MFSKMEENIMFLKRLVSCLVFVVIFVFSTVNLYADGQAIMVASEFVPDSKASILMEQSTGDVLAEKNSSEKMQIGTLNKIMTALLVAESIDNGKLGYDTMVTTSNHANSMKQAVIWLNVGEKMSVDDLLKGMIVGNANDASVALAEAVSGTEPDFVKRMNNKAVELGMINTYFKNCTGIDDEAQYSTAYDVALMSREIVKHTDLHKYMTCWMDHIRNGETEIVNTNRLVKTYKGIIGIKASYTNLSLNCLSVAATRNNMTYVSVVLGCKDKDSRFTEAKNLMDKGFSSYKSVTPKIPEELLQPVHVSGGVEHEVFPKIENLKNIVSTNEQIKNIKCEYTIEENLKAPIRENDKIGEISFYLNDKLVYTTNLLASSEISDMTFYRALCILTKNMFRF